MLRIDTLTPDQTDAALDEFAELLIDAVSSGGSIGFMPPLGTAEALDYWRTVIDAMRQGHRILLAAVEDGQIQGSVQLALETRPNGNHRAEMMKLFVHRRARRRGLARRLMQEAEEVARGQGRTLLLMDTRAGGEADQLCQSLGYVRLGEVPNYARTPDGQLHRTAFYYRQLD